MAVRPMMAERICRRRKHITLWPHPKPASGGVKQHENCIGGAARAARAMQASHRYHGG